MCIRKCQSMLLASLLCLLSVFAFVSASAQAQTQAQTQAQNLSYSLGAGDLIYISVYEEEDLSFEVLIGESGNVTFPFLGEIRVTGNTTNGVESIISRGLIDGEFLIRPEVTVNIVEYRPFYIDGEVEDPGSYPFEPGLTLRKAITIAGGFTERASRSKISIISAARESGEPVEAESLEVSVNPGDIITVDSRFF